MVYMEDYNWALYDAKPEAEESNTESTVSGENGTTDNEGESTEADGEKTDKNGIKDSDYMIHSEAEVNAMLEKIKEKGNAFI